MKKVKQHVKASKRELRVHVAPQQFEIRKNADGSQTISGYAATFNDLSQDLGGFKEKIQPGAFSQSLKSHPDVLILYAHDSSLILGRGSSGTLQISEDAKGLRFTAKLPKTSTGNDVAELMSRGDISAMSFGFSVPEDGDFWDVVGDQVIRTLLRVNLYEISVVGEPAYLTSSVNLRSLPKELRGKVKRKVEDDDLEDDLDNDPDDDDDEECRCECTPCASDDNCAGCTNEDCDGDEDGCEGCAMESRALHLDLLRRRLTT